MVPLVPIPHVNFSLVSLSSSHWIALELTLHGDTVLAAWLNLHLFGIRVTGAGWSRRAQRQCCGYSAAGPSGPKHKIMRSLGAA